MQTYRELISMYHNTAEPKALPLSKEETLALLELCLNSALEMQPVHEQALSKLGDLARSYMAEEISAEPAPEPIAAPAVLEHEYEMPVRVTFWTRASIRSRLRSVPAGR